VAGEGSVFTVGRPLTVAPASGDGMAGPAERAAPVVALVPNKDVEAAPAVSAEVGAKPLVLLVEDNADMRAYVRSHLEDAYAVEEAADGEVGLAMAREAVPDLVLSDVMMPKMDGHALTSALKAEVSTSHIPVLMLTARGEVEDRIDGYGVGADGYLSKPFNAKELRARVAGLIAERRRLHAYYHAQGAQAETTLLDEGTPALPAREHAFIAEVKQVIETHLDVARFNVNQLADAMALSPRQLTRKLTALTAETPAVMLRRMRLEQAKQLLSDGYTVKEVASRVGFKSVPSFSRAFTLAYDQPPSRYAASKA